MQDVPELFDRTSPSAHVVSAWGLFVSFSCQCQISLNQQQCGQELFQIACRVQSTGLWHRIFSYSFCAHRTSTSQLAVCFLHGAERTGTAAILICVVVSQMAYTSAEFLPHNVAGWDEVLEPQKKQNFGHKKLNTLN